MTSLTVKKVAGVSSSFFQSLGLFLLLGVVGVWFWETHPHTDYFDLFSRPTEIYKKTTDRILSGKFASDVSASFEYIWIFFFGSCFGFLSGAFVSLFRRSGYFFTAMYAALNGVPLTGIFFLFAVWLGPGDEARLLFVLYATSVLTGALTFFEARSVFRAYPDVFSYARGLGAGNWRIFTKVLLPFLVPFFFQTQRIGSKIGFTSVVLVELVGGKKGLGNALHQGREHLDVALMFHVLITLALFNFVYWSLSHAAEYYFCGTKRNNH